MEFNIRKKEQTERTGSTEKKTGQSGTSSGAQFNIRKKETGSQPSTKSAARANQNTAQQRSGKSRESYDSGLRDRLTREQNRGTITGARATFSGDRNGTAKGRGFAGENTTLGQRVADTVIGGAKGSLGANINAAAALYDAGQMGRTGKDSVSDIGKDTAERGLQEAQYALQVMEEDNREKPGTWTRKDLAQQQGIIDDWARKLNGYEKTESAQRGAVQASYGLADQVQQSAQSDLNNAKVGLGSVGQILVDAGASTTQSTLDAAANLLLGGASMAPFAFRAFGGGTQQARNDRPDSTLQQQLLYGTASAAKEVFTEKMFNLALPFSKAYGGGALDDVVERGIRTAVDRFAKTDVGKRVLGGALTFGAGAVGEGLEELIGDWMEWQMPRIYGGDVASAGETLESSLYDFLVGAASGAMGGMVTPTTYRYDIGDTAGARQNAAIDNAYQAMQENGMFSRAGQTARDQANRVIEGNRGQMEGRNPAAQQAQQTGQAAEDALMDTAQEMVQEQNRQAGSDPLTEALSNGKRVNQEQLTPEQREAWDSRDDVWVDAKDNVYQMDPAQHISQRTFEGVGDRKVNAFQFDHPELQSYYKQAAEQLVRDAGLSIDAPKTTRVERGAQGKRYIHEILDTPSLRNAMDMGLSRNQVIQAAQDLIADKGQENNAAAKRLEFVLDDMLTRGYTTAEGESVEANSDYIRAKEAIPGYQAEQRETLPIWDTEESSQPEAAGEQEVAQRLERVSRAASALGENGAKALTASYTADTARVVEPAQAVEGFYYAYNSALNGETLSGTAAEKADALPAHMRLAAENAGERDAARASQAKFFGEDAGLVKDQNYRKAHLSSKTRDALDALGKALGVKVQFAETVADGQANAQYGNGVITLSLDAEDPVLTSTVHEAVHRIRETSPEVYNTLTEFVQQTMTAEGLDFNLSERAKLYGTDDTSALTEEMVADAFGRMLGNEETVTRFTKTHRNAAQKVMDVLRDIVNAVKRVLNHQNLKLTPEQKAAFQDLEGQVETMEKLFENALKKNETRNEQKKTAREGGTAKFSIKETENGQYYVKADRQVLEGNDPAKWGKQLENFINNEIRHNRDVVLPTTDGNLIRLTERSAYKLSDRKSTNLKDHQKSELSPAQFKAKENAAAHIDEIILVGEFKSNADDIGGYHQNDIGEDGFNTYDAYFEDHDGRYYLVQFTSALNGDVETAYSIGAMRKRKKPAASKGSSALESGAQESGRLSTGRVAQNAEEVKTKFSLKEDSQGHKLTEAQQEFFKDSQIRDADGRLMAMYHGTTAYNEITKFRKGHSGWLGPGIYLSSRKADAQHYADAMGIGDGTVYELYADVSNPLVVTQSNPVPEILMAAYGRESVYERRSAKQGNDTYIVTPADIKKLQSKGYDGIRWDFGKATELSVFSPEQLKRVDNQNPTSNPDIRYSLKEYTDEEKKQHVKDAVAYFGRTYKWAETGYITTDGKRLDFSGRHEGGPGGYRTVDHRDISDALGDDYGGDDYSGSMVQFMSEGNIRISPESGGINLSVMPTKAQLDTLSDFISKQRGEVILDLDTVDGNTVSSTEYPRGTHANKVLNDIKAYFENGSTPHVSELAQFRYSLKKFDDGQRFVDVQTDQKQFDGLTDKEKTRMAIKIIKDRFAGHIIGIDNQVFVNGRSAAEYGHPVKNIDTDIRNAKMRASTELDNLVDAGTNFRTKPDGMDGHVHPKSVGDFQYFDTIFKVGQEYYKGVINIEQTARGSLLKDITKIKNITQDISSSYGDNPKSTFLRDASMDSIRGDQADVNEKFSLSDRELLADYVKEYGAIPKGETPSREITLPKKTGDGKNLSRTVRTILEAGATPDEMVPSIEKLAARGDFSYDTYTDKQAISDAESKIRKVGWGQALGDWTASMKKGEVSKANTAMGWALYNNAANGGDTKTALTVLEQMVEHQRSAAQALQATRILKKMSPETQLYGVQRSVENLQEELNSRYGKKKGPELKINQELAERFMQAKDQTERDEALKEIYRDIGRQMPSTFLDRWNAWRYLSMLGNPRTHVRNVAGNAGFVPVVAVKDLTGTAIEAAVSRVTGGKLERTKALVGFGKKDRALLSAAWGDCAKVQETAMGGGKYSDLANANRYIEEGRRIFKTKPLETFRKANGAALDAEDVWFSKPHYAYALTQFCKANNITAEQIASGKGIKRAREYAILEAQKATYRDTNALSQAISGLGRANMDSKNPVKKGIATLAEGILPFRKTPANILARGLEYSPLGLGKGIKEALVDVSKGDKTAAEAIDSISAGLTGTGLLALGIYMAAQGLVRGSGGDDDKKKELEELQGHQDYALELPNGTSVTLDWLAPECLPFFVGVNLWENTEGERATLSDWLTAAATVTDPLLSMSCLQSLNDVFDTVSNVSNGGLEGLPAALSSAATSYLTQALPTLLGQVERTWEDKRYTTYTEKNAFLTGDMQYTLGKASARIPGWDYNQIPYIDAWGRTESSGGVGYRAANNFLNPAYLSKIEASDMENELLRLYEATGEAGVLPQRADKSFTVGNEKKELTGEEYVTYATVKGQTAYELLTNLVKSKEYQAMSDEEKVTAVSNVYKAANQTAKAAISDYEPETWIRNAQEAEKKYGISQNVYISLRTKTARIDGLKDKDGETITNSKSLLIMQEVYNTPGLTDKQRQALFEYMGVGMTVRHYNKAKVKEKLAQMRKQ